MSYKLENSWLGIGAKWGGSFILFGAERTKGQIFNLANPSTRYFYACNTFRLGPGLGGGGNLAVLVALDCPNIWEFHKKWSTSWGINFSIGGPWSKLVKTLKSADFFAEVAKVSPALTGLTGTTVEKLRMGMHQLYNTVESGKSKGTPWMGVIDLPLGVGLEASMSLTRNWTQLSTANVI